MKLLKRVWQHRINYLFIAPIIILYVVFAFLPIVQTFFMSFFDSKIVSRGPFVGLANYQAIAVSKEFQSTILNTFNYTIASIVFSIGIALMLAVFINLPKLKGKTLFKILFFLPVVTSPVAVGYIWKWILEPDHGILNLIISRISGKEGPLWLSDPKLALMSVTVVNIWKWIGYFLVILFANLQLIDPEYYDSASIDGASALQKFVHITIPLLYQALILCIILGFIAFMRSFALVFVMTKGGPAGSTELMVTYIYRKAFATGRMEIGISSAASIVLFILLMVFNLVFRRLAQRREYL